MRPKLYRGSNDSGYARRRLSEIHQQLLQLASALEEQRRTARDTRKRCRRVLLVTVQKAA